ncbi:MAG TPA: leucine-rich repeat protein [Candidatus Lokiarchaeia archaeon]|nr:leucine-rich repeat protein [Candidatus Lokiarchaeia archaeon]
MSVSVRGKEFKVKKEGVLDLHDQGIIKITEIKGLDVLGDRLLSLELDNNQIKKIEGLEALGNLQELHLDNNQIAKIEGIGTLGNLRELHLNSNQITRIVGLEALGNLRILTVHFNPIAWPANLPDKSYSSAVELVNYCCEATERQQRGEVEIQSIMESIPKMAKESEEVAITSNENIVLGVGIFGMEIFWIIIFAFILPNIIFLIIMGALLAFGFEAIFRNGFKAWSKFKLSSISKGVKYWPLHTAIAIGCFIIFGLSSFPSASGFFPFPPVGFLVFGAFFALFGVATFILSIRIKRRKKTAAALRARDT